MTGWALDTSLALAWVLPDETSAEAERFLEKASAKDVFWVPALWWYEVANALAVAQRRRRITQADGLRAIELYRSLPLETDFFAGPDALWRFHSLAQEHGLSAYDAVYLELAERRGLALASLDVPLMEAAKKAGVAILKVSEK